MSSQPPHPSSTSNTLSTTNIYVPQFNQCPNAHYRKSQHKLSARKMTFTLNYRENISYGLDTFRLEKPHRRKVNSVFVDWLRARDFKWMVPFNFMLQPICSWDPWMIRMVYSLNRCVSIVFAHTHRNKFCVDSNALGKHCNLNESHQVAVTHFSVGKLDGRHYWPNSDRLLVSFRANSRCTWIVQISKNHLSIRNHTHCVLHCVHHSCFKSFLTIFFFVHYFEWN